MTYQTLNWARGLPKYSDRTPYRISFRGNGKPQVWIQYHPKMSDALIEGKKAAYLEFTTVEQFMIESPQEDWINP